MKFKYNYSEHWLWRITEDHLYEINEADRHIEVFPLQGYKIQFRLGENHYLLCCWEDECGFKMTVCLTKPLKNGEIAHYEKQITRGWFDVEKTFEFTEQDRNNNHHEKS